MQFRDFAGIDQYQRQRELLRRPGALIGLLGTALLCRWGWGSRCTGSSPPWGLRRVAVCRPGQPLAQPWSILVGNGVSAPDGVLSASLVPDMAIASALAVMLAIAAMFLTRSLHLPGGAVVLTAIIGGEGSGRSGSATCCCRCCSTPVAAESGLALQPRSGASLSPWRQGGAQSPPDGGSPAECPTRHPGHRLCPCKTRGELLDISRQDLQELLQEAQLHAPGRASGDGTVPGCDVADPS